MQGKRQCRCVVWIINWALQIHCNPRVPLDANNLVSEDWTKRDHRELQRIYGIDIAFESWVKVLPDLLKLSNFLSLDPVFSKTKIISFLFQTMKNDWVWRKVSEKYIFIVSVLVDIVRVLFFPEYHDVKSLTLSFKVSSQFKLI